MAGHKFTFGNLRECRRGIPANLPNVRAAGSKNTTGREVKRTGNLAFNGHCFFTRRRIRDKDTVCQGFGVGMTGGS